jgi:hypothetical protein
MSTDEMIAVLQAHKEGKKVQARGRPGEGDEEWHNVIPNWDFYRAEFRVKPEPRDFFICFKTCIGDGKTGVYTSKQQGLESIGMKQLHVREVIE